MKIYFAVMEIVFFVFLVLTPTFIEDPIKECITVFAFLILVWICLGVYAVLIKLDNLTKH